VWLAGEVPVAEAHFVRSPNLPRSGCLKSNAEITTDFDAIATALRAAPPETHLTAALRAVLDAIPPNARRGLEIGRASCRERVCSVV
jgi:hypothetical protein